jgi:hypothetical protein
MSPAAVVTTALAAPPERVLPLLTPLGDHLTSGRRLPPQR